jgi:hypothetical protein
LKGLTELTGLSTIQLLSFWGPISTSGSPSLYSQLFLTHNLLGLDQVFVADASDNYLAASSAEKISGHKLVLLAAFGMKLPAFNDFVASISDDLKEDLTVESVSLMYRYVLLGRVLGVKPELLNDVFETFGIKPFGSAGATLELVDLWNRMSDAGFTFPQLRYVFTERDDILQPVGPSPRTMLQVAWTLYTGLNDIDKQHPGITSESAVTSAAVLTKVQLLYTPDMTSFKPLINLGHDAD